jgi:D-xylose transport system ATP-binding protein
VTTPSADDARPADAGRASVPESNEPPQTPAGAENPSETAAVQAEAAAAQAETAAADAESAAAEAETALPEVPAVQAEAAAAQAETAATDAESAAAEAETAFAEASATADSNGDQPLLRLVGIGKHFGPVVVLTDINLDVPLGQVTALVGDNGAGKSTLIKTISGIYQQDQGQIIWEGRPVRLHSPKDATDLGIATVYQDLALADNLDIVQNMFLGREPVKHFQLDEVTMELQAKQTLADLQVVTVRSVRQPVGSLSGGQRQAVAVAKAVLRQAQLVIMDEPTAALGVTQTRVVLDLIRRLKSQNIAVIVISHNLNDVQSVADRIAVMRLGHLVSVGPLARYDNESIVDLMTTGTSKRLAAIPAEPSSGSSSEH